MLKKNNGLADASELYEYFVPERFVSGDDLSQERVVPEDALSPITLCPSVFYVRGHFVPRTLVPGSFVSGHFVSGRFVRLPFFPRINVVHIQ
jgi:hypothetical protein